MYYPQVSWLSRCVVFIFALISCQTMAGNHVAEDGRAGFKPSTASQASWLFSGKLHNEAGDNYGYYFMLQQVGDTVKSQTVLLDLDNERLLANYQNTSGSRMVNASKWLSGNAFLQFKPISDSWIIGLQKDNQSAFNLKTDMPRKQRYTLPKQQLSSDMSLFLTRTSRVNGHLLIDDSTKEQFVTQGHASFQQLALSDNSHKTHQIRTIHCHFAEGDDLYAINLPEKHAQQGALVIWVDAKGKKQLVSQFIRVTQDVEHNTWRITLRGPNQLSLAFTDQMPPKSPVHIGFTKSNKRGFCIIQTTQFTDLEQGT